MTFLEGRKVPEVSFPWPVPERKWTCTCGRVMDMSAAFCSACGTRRPEPRRCPNPNCGATVENDAEFCVRCGTPLGRSVGTGVGGSVGGSVSAGVGGSVGAGVGGSMGARAGGYSRPESVRETTKICPMCGNASRETAANCSFCGFDFNGKKFWGTLVKPTDDDMR